MESASRVWFSGSVRASVSVWSAAPSVRIRRSPWSTICAWAARSDLSVAWNAGIVNAVCRAAFLKPAALECPRTRFPCCRPLPCRLCFFWKTTSLAGISCTLASSSLSRPLGGDQERGAASRHAARLACHVGFGLAVELAISDAASIGRAVKPSVKRSWQRPNHWVSVCIWTWNRHCPCPEVFLSRISIRGTDRGAQGHRLSVERVRLYILEPGADLYFQSE